jgi:rSAM/selenodomain-associated transferase 2
MNSNRKTRRAAVLPDGLRLSVVMPALNETATLAATLAPLQPLRARGHEVIVVDGGSCDGTLALACVQSDRAFSAPTGRASQMNAGAAVARGDVLVFLHADSRLPDDAVAAIAAALSEGKRWGRFDVAITGKPRVLRLVAGAMNVRSRWTGIATGDQAIFVTRELFIRAGGFPNIALMEDIALSRILKRRAGRPACVRSRVLTSGRRWEANGPWRTIFRMWRLRLAYALGADPARLAREYRS